MIFRRTVAEEVLSSAMSFGMVMPEHVLTQVLRKIQQQDGEMLEHVPIWKGLDNQRRENQFCDAQIHCAQDVTLPAHKCILALVSPYFKTLFTSLLTNSTINHQDMDLRDYSKEVIAVLLDYVYTGKADLGSVDLVELLKLAEFLQHSQLIKHLMEGILVTLNASTWLLWFSVGIECGVADLTTLSIRYMILHGLPLRDGVPHELTEKIVQMKNQIATKNINLYHRVGQVYAVDITQKRVEELKTGIFCLKNRIDSSHENFRILSLSMMNGKLFRAAAYTDKRRSRLRFAEKDIKIQISSYQRVPTKGFRRTHLMDMVRLLKNEFGFDEGDVDDKVQRYGYMDVKQLTFDKQNHLLILIADEVQHFIVKYDLSEGEVLNDFIWHDIPSSGGSLRPGLEPKFVESKRKGTLLVRGIEHVYDIESFDFTKRFHSKTIPSHLKQNEAEKLTTKLKLGHDCSSSTPAADEIPSNEETTLPADNPNVHACKILSVNGEIYSFVVFVDKRSRVVALHFDTEQLSWMEVCRFPIDDHELSNAFTCSGKCYVVLSLEKFQQKDINGNALRSSEVVTDQRYEVVYKWDVDRKTFGRVSGMCMPPFGKKYMCSEIPEYFLV